MDTSNFMSLVKSSYSAKLNKLIEDPKLANNIDLDQNKIVTIIIIGYAFKTFKLVMTIFQVSYFIGIFFYIYCSLVRDIHEARYGKPVFATEVERDEYDA